MSRLITLMCDAALDACSHTLIVRDVTSPATLDEIMKNNRWTHHNGKDYGPCHSAPTVSQPAALYDSAQKA